MVERPSYLVILPHHGLFSSHWVDQQAFEAARKLRDRGESPMVIEVPETDGISIVWKMEIPEVRDATQDNPEPTGEKE